MVIEIWCLGSRNGGVSMVVRGGESGGKWRIKGVFGSSDPKILTTPSSSPKAFLNVCEMIEWNESNDRN
ncbi:hypothetical protein Tco_0624831 [Tanacetum coccineum]|uniref:Uncharacterized protein n=1 Tax=Tanacetum coccineum TaxID=301880 RepID=A0ABQ4WF34_9ASTR